MCHNKFVDEVQSATKVYINISYVFFVSEHISSAAKNDAKCHMWHLYHYLKKSNKWLTSDQRSHSESSTHTEHIDQYRAYVVTRWKCVHLYKNAM